MSTVNDFKVGQKRIIPDNESRPYTIIAIDAEGGLLRIRNVDGGEMDWALVDALNDTLVEDVEEADVHQG